MSGEIERTNGVGWCILRVTPSRTLQLAAALADGGFNVWTPIEAVKVSKRGRLESTSRPMLPSFVFASADRLAELMDLSHSPSPTYLVWDAEQRRMVAKGYPYFRIFRPSARPIPDHELTALRRIEGRRKPRGKVPMYKAGDPVKLTEGVYGGLRGVVVEVRKKSEVRVRIPGSTYEFDVQAWILIPDPDGPLDADGDIHHNRAQSERVNSFKDAA
jgi:transcription antitermination factor NusG